MSVPMYGCFECPNCNRTWESCPAWGAKGSPRNPGKAMGQKCIKCQKGFVKPYILDYLPDGMDLKKPHLQDKCQKCKNLGRPCWLR